MTVKLLSAWGAQPPGTLFASDAATEAAMVAAKVATATLTGGVAWAPNLGTANAGPPPFLGEKTGAEVAAMQAEIANQTGLYATGSTCLLMPAGFLLTLQGIGTARQFVAGGGGALPLGISGAPVLSAVAGAAYSGFSVAAFGGTSPYTFSVVNGPAGMVVNSAGAVTYPSPAAGTYAAIVIRVTDNTGGVANLPPFALTVSAAGGGVVAPVITAQPSAQSVTAPAPATFSVAASNGGGTLTYQWRKGGVPISGAGSSYTTPATQLSDSGGSFDVVVTNSAGSVTSNAVGLTVSAAAADTRPRFANGPANPTGDASIFATFFASTVPLTGSASGGKSGTFNTVADSTAYTWVFVLRSAAPSGVRVFDGTGYGGFSGAQSTGLNVAGDPNDPITTSLGYTDAGGNVWDAYRSNGKAKSFNTYTLS